MILAACWLAGLVSLPLWPPAWRTGVALGWTAGLVSEHWLNRRRLGLMRGGKAGRALAVAAEGYLLRLLLLGAGALAGGLAELFHVPSYLLAFLAAVFLGEAIGLPALHRASARSSRPPP